MGKKFEILNDKGEPIVLNQYEQKRAQINQRLMNDLGYDIDITALTTIMKKVTSQKFYEIAPADYLPVRVGEGAWSQQLTTYRSFAVGDDFSSGIVNTGAGDSRLAVADAGVDSLSVPVFNWAKSIGWTIMDLEQASKAGNWDLVTAKEKSRKQNWDLGIQRVAFLGLEGSASVKGLLNQSGVTNNTTRITKYIKDMTPAEITTFLGGLLGDYRTNCARTAWPTHFIIPETDYLGLATPPDSTYPLKTKLELIQDAMRVMTKNPNFQVIPLAYCDAGENGVDADDAYYVLLNYEEESLRMDIPVDYTSTMANSFNSFNFTNVGYGQFTGALAYRPKELMYFSWDTNA